MIRGVWAWMGRACVLGVVGLVVAGCARERAGAREVEFWAMGREGEAVARLVGEFERAHPGVRVRVQQIPWSAAHEKLLTAHVGRALPDVVQVGSTWLPELVAVGALAPLDAWVADPGFDREDYFPGVLDAATIDGRTWGLPWYVDTRLLFYRADMLRAVGVAEPPATWTAWLDVLARLERRQGAGRYAILLPLTEWETPVALAWQHGARLLRDGGRYGDFRSPAFRAALRFYADLFERGLAPRAGAGSVANLYQDFARGYFALFVSGPWSIGELGRRLPPELAGVWSTAPMPARDDAAPGISVVGGASLAVTATSADKDAAWQWIAFLSDPARQRAFHEATGDLPARPSAWRAAGLDADPRARAFWTQLQRVRAVPTIPEWERIARKVGDAGEAVARGWRPVDEAAAALDRDVDEILEKRRWMLDHDRPLWPDADAGRERVAWARGRR